MERLRRSTGKLRRRGIAIVQTAVVSTLVGFGVAALAIDTGLMFSAKSELQTAADSAALAAAAELGAGQDSEGVARARAAEYAEKNQVAMDGATIDPYADVVLGHATFDSSTGKYTFHADLTPFDAVQVTARRTGSAADGALRLMFARCFGVNTSEIQATAIAMLVPRDIAMVIDLSGSMNDDSELMHHKDFPSETQGVNRDGVQINLKDIWTALPIAKGQNGVGNGANPAAPGAATANNNQPGNYAGVPKSVGGNPDDANEAAGGSANPAGPRWGWMTGWGRVIELDNYDPVGDPGLYYIPRSSTCTDANVIANLTEAGYSTSERNALLSGSNDGTWTYYRNRVKVILGVAGWRSGMSGGKFTGGSGNGNTRVDDSEVYQQPSYPFASGSWDSFVTYVADDGNSMNTTDNNFRYRYGLKTFVNYILETRSANNQTPELASTPEQPLLAVKDAVQAMANKIEDMQSLDNMSLVIFGKTSKIEVSLTDDLQSVPERLYQMQSNHYDGYTNIGAGMNAAVQELTGPNSRSAANKMIVLMTDGKPNCDANGSFVGNGAGSAVGWANDRANYAVQNYARIFTVAVGQDADIPLTVQIAAIGGGEQFYATGTPEVYTPALLDIFETLAGKRSVQLIR